MRIALKAVHTVFTEAANDGSILLDPTRDIFGDIAKVQPRASSQPRTWRQCVNVGSRQRNTGSVTRHAVGVEQTA